VPNFGVPGALTSVSTFFQVTSDPASPSYTVPVGGPWTVTSWRVPGGTGTGDPIFDTPATLQLAILRPTTPGHFQVIARSKVESLPARQNPTFATSIPVLPGDKLGVDVTASYGINHTYPGKPGDAVGGFGSDGSASGPGSQGELLNLSATITAPDPPVKKCKKRKKHHGKHASAAKKKHKKHCKRKRKRR
jgi:hypothetical protein